jgi:hypothetical protein
MLAYLLLALVFIVPGYALLPRRFAGDERLAFSAAASLILYGAAAVLVHVLGLPVSYALSVLPFSLAYAAYRRPQFNASTGLLKVSAVAFLLAFAVQSLQSYPISGDGLFQMLAGGSFLTSHWMSVDYIDNYFTPITYPWPVALRPPMNPFGLGLAYSVLGFSYDVSKLYSAFFLAPLSAGVYVLARKLYDERTAFFGTLIMVSLNPYSLLLGADVQVYHVAAYFIVCFLILFLCDYGWLYLAFMAGVLYLVHPMCLVFMGGLLAYEMCFGRLRLSDVISRKAVLFAVVALLAASPWLVRNFAVFGNPFFTSGKYLPFYRDWEDHFMLEPPTPSYYLSYISDPKNLLLVKGGALIKTMLPSPYSFSSSEWRPLALVDPVALGFTVAGLLSYPVFFAALYFGLREWRRLVPFLFAFSLMSSAVIYGMRHDYEYSLMYAEVLLFGVFGLSKVKDDRRLIALVAAILLFESAVVYSNRLTLTPDSEAFEWISKNTPPDALIMSHSGDTVNFMTGRRSLVTPKADRQRIVRFVRDNGVDYYAVNKEDLRLRDVDLAFLNGTYLLRKETRDFWIYETGKTAI